MFLKRCERRKSGKKHTYWVLVESYRTARGSRHRIVAYLGELCRGEASGWAQLGRTLSGKRRTRPERSLFDPPHDNEPDDDEPVLVKLKDILHERLRGFGDVWLAWGLWRLLERELRRAMGRAGAESLPLYPEGRACRRPTARRVIDLFEDVQRHELTAEGQTTVVFSTELTRLQRRVLRLLGMPRAYSG